MRLRLFCKGRPSLWLPPPIFFWSCPKENGPWTVQKKKRYDEQEDRSVLLFVVTGVVRIGAAGIGGPVVPAPDHGRQKLRPRIRWCGRWSGRWTGSAYFYSRAFRFATRCPGVPCGISHGLCRTSLHRWGRTHVFCSRQAFIDHPGSAQRSKKRGNRSKSNPMSTPFIRPRPLCGSRALRAPDVRRRDDGAPDPRRTDSHDPRTPAKRPGRGVLPPGGFLFHRPRHILFCQDKREWGAESSGNLPASPEGADPPLGNPRPPHPQKDGGVPPKNMVYW